MRKPLALLFSAVAISVLAAVSVPSVAQAGAADGGTTTGATPSASPTPSTTPTVKPEVGCC
jgi:hypothetical protein